MQVITLNESAFDTHAERLAQLVEKSTVGAFDAIVAVRRGGSYVCDAFCRYFPHNRYGERYDITLQRPSTKRKNGLVSKLLKCLPTPLLDIMRMAESYILSLRRQKKDTSPILRADMPDGLEAILKKRTSPKILIIDDAIDSGDTLFSIVNTLKETNPNTMIWIAVMTETTKSPRIRADFTLYRNRTLIRFPWSNDYKKH